MCQTSDKDDDAISTRPRATTSNVWRNYVDRDIKEDDMAVVLVDLDRAAEQCDAVGRNAEAMSLRRVAVRISRLVGPDRRTGKISSGTD